MALAYRWSRLLSLSPLPANRSSHTVTSVAGRIAVFGGEDAPRNAFDRCVHLLDLGGSWKQGTAEIPGLPLLGHGAASAGPKLFVFGGRAGGPNTFDGSTDGERGELWAYDVEADAWSKPLEGYGNSHVVQPEPRSFHAMCSGPALKNNDGDKSDWIFMFGGCGQRGRLNDLWCFNPHCSTWDCLCPGGSEAPKPRGGASLVAVEAPSGNGVRLVLVYGFSGKQQGDLAIFDTETGKWKHLPQEAQGGEVPSPRSVFCSTAVGRRLFCFGGERVESDAGHAGAGEFTNDAYFLDLDSITWQKLQVNEDGPCARGWSGCGLFGTDHIALFGGLDSSNTRLGDVWTLSLA